MLAWSIERLWEAFPSLVPSEAETDADTSSYELECAYLAVKKAESQGNATEMVRLLRNQTLLRRYVESQIAQGKPGRHRLDRKGLNRELHAKIARKTLARLRAIWRTAYGKVYRGRSNAPSAEHIVEQFYAQDLHIPLKKGWQKKH